MVRFRVIPAVLLAIVFPLLLAGEAPPVEFGLSELRQAVHRKGLKRKVRIRTEITTAEPGSYRIIGARITGGDLRGLMYGLLTAAEQIRTYGRLVPARGKPAVAIRGIRRFLHNEDLEQDWYYSHDYWREYIEMLARNRFNRLNLVFAHQTSYLAPPYPYWVEVKEFPGIRVPGLTAAQRKKNLETLCYIAQTAADHAIDFTLGIWQQNIQPGMTPSVEGLTPENVGPYSYRALKKVLAACPAIRSVQVRTNGESGIPRGKQVTFYRDYICRAIREAGRLVTLDLRGWAMDKGMLKAVTDSGVPARLSAKYWAEHLVKPYQPAETFPGYSYLDFLRKPRSYDFFWEIWTLGSHRLLLWGDPDFVKRAAPTLTLSGSKGFEIDAPLAQKGFGNRPGKWGIFAGGHEDRIFWKRDFERYWMFYLLWGRLTYNPKAPARLWESELKRRFPKAAGEVLEAYRSASRVLSEILYAHMPDPNMYMWPEIGVGGLIDFYKNAMPGDWRYVVSIPEAVRNRTRGIASAKQTPSETASRLRALADQIEAAIRRVDKEIAAGNKEWAGTKPDFRVLAALARFHAHRQLAAEHLACFDQTVNGAELDAAERELKAGLKEWQKLSEWTTGLYPMNMVYGPEDTGHWKDKLPYLRHDLETIRERRWLLERFGSFQFGFDFGGKIRTEWDRYTVEPRFLPVAPDTSFEESRGYGWVTEGDRRAVAIRTPPRDVLRASKIAPMSLPENLLFGDSILGKGTQVFRVRTGAGEYRVSLLHPDGNLTTTTVEAHNGVVDVVFPEREWRISGLFIKGHARRAVTAFGDSPKRPPRPRFSHIVPRRVHAGQALTLRLRISPRSAASVVRLHYRHLNTLEKFRTLEVTGGDAVFTIPAEEITSEWDLLYYFEVLNHAGSGWFYPDPDARTPYYVLNARAPAGNNGAHSRK